jgi:hypothetical protein
MKHHVNNSKFVKKWDYKIHEINIYDTLDIVVSN